MSCALSVSRNSSPLSGTHSCWYQGTWKNRKWEKNCSKGSQKTWGVTFPLGSGRGWWNIPLPCQRTEPAGSGSQIWCLSPQVRGWIDMSSVCLGSSLGVRKQTSSSHSYNRGGIEVTQVDCHSALMPKPVVPIGPHHPALKGRQWWTS